MLINKNKLLPFAAGLLVGISGMLLISPTSNKKEQQSANDKLSKESVGKRRKNQVSIKDRKVKNNTRSSVETLFTGKSSGSFSDLFHQATTSNNSVYKDHLLRVLVMEWSKVDPAYALETVSSMENERNDLLHIILEQQSLADSKASIEWLDKNIKDPQRHSYLMISVLKSLATNSPHEAIELAKSLPKGSDQTNGLSAVVDQWVKTDPHAALSWLSSKPKNQQMVSIYTSAMYQYVNKDPEQASVLIQSMGNSSLKTSLTAECARKYAMKDLDAAINWAHNLTEAKAQDQALLNVIDVWSQQEPKQALGYVVEKADDPAFNAIVKQTVITLANNDPIALIENFENLPKHHQPFASGRIAQALLRENAETALEWIDVLPDGEAKNRVIKEAIGHYISFSPSKAFELAESSGTAYNRKVNLKHVLKNWSKVDFNSAQRALSNTTSLSYDQKQRLLEEMTSVAESVNVVLPH